MDVGFELDEQLDSSVRRCSHSKIDLKRRFI